MESTVTRERYRKYEEDLTKKIKNSKELLVEIQSKYEELKLTAVSKDLLIDELKKQIDSSDKR